MVLIYVLTALSVLWGVKCVMNIRGGVYVKKYRYEDYGLRFAPLLINIDKLRIAKCVAVLMVSVGSVLLLLALLNFTGVITPLYVLIGTSALAMMVVAGVLIAAKVLQLKEIRNSYVEKWKSEEVFGGDHDAEVSVYRGVNKVYNFLELLINLLIFWTIFCVAVLF
jgi:hypothetical protein